MGSEMCIRDRTHDIEAIFKFGLHDFLQKMISLFADLSEQIEIDYRFYE